MARAAAAVDACDALLFTAGAGMGVDSGLPSFRGTTGLWKDKDLAMTYEDMSDDKWFREDPAFAWGVNYTQLDMYRSTVPHDGFAVLLRWATELGKPYYVFTSNIDGQFQLAGFPDDRVVTCHGDLLHLQCTEWDCRGKKEADDAWPADCIPPGLKEEIDAGSLRFRDTEQLEADWFRCPKCRKLARPNVWFCSDRNYRPRPSSIRKHAVFNRWLEAIQEEGRRLVVIECGGGLDIPSVRVESEDAVEGAGEGSVLIRLNPENCRVPADRGLGLPLGARAGLQRIAAALEGLGARRPSAKQAFGARQGRGGSSRRQPGAATRVPARRGTPSPRRPASEEPAAAAAAAPPPRNSSARQRPRSAVVEPVAGSQARSGSRAKSGSRARPASEVAVATSLPSRNSTARQSHRSAAVAPVAGSPPKAQPRPGSRAESGSPRRPATPTRCDDDTGDEGAAAQGT